ncbi:ion transporter [Flavobacteriaceae bacterium]|jgi:voltage-gated potassium channel|nr:ion transporter [Flavobacteriaceae bacterium]MDC3350906.1 ion transporter [Flavobacteriaceae bacterium]
MSLKYNERKWKEKLHEIIYEADTPAGKLFDIILLIVILLSVVLVMLESIGSIESKYANILDILEWVITILFSVEYIARIISVKSPKSYVFSFYGIIDFLSIIPKYISLFILGTNSLLALRALRLLRVFRILKLTRFIGESANFGKALKRSRAKIAVFITFVIVLCIILGTIMYLVENEHDSGFTSIPRSVYWAIVTLTTVGYGDIAPITSLGQFIASMIMILGYGIIAIPTGIVTSEMTKNEKDLIPNNTQNCTNCSEDYHQDNAKFCHKCGNNIEHG